jgi:hypothetical protein
MRVTEAPVGEIDFDWTNFSNVSIKRRLPHSFLLKCVQAHESGESYVDHLTDGGNRIVGRLTPEGHIDYIINPEEHMVKE